MKLFKLFILFTCLTVFSIPLVALQKTIEPNVNNTLQPSIKKISQENNKSNDGKSIASSQTNFVQRKKTVNIHNQNNNFKPPVYFWISLVFAGVTIFWNIFIFFYNKRKARNDIIDEYWIRKIAVPICVNPLIHFINDYADKLKQLNELDKSNISVLNDALVEYQINFKEKKEIIIKKFYVLSSKWSNVFNVISQNLDKLDDAITMHCYINQSISKSDKRQINKYTINEDVFYTSLGEMLADLSGLHTSNI